MTKLGDAIHKGAAAGKSPATRLEAALSGKRPFKPVTVLVHGVPHDAVMTTIGSERSLDIEGEVARAMERRGLEQNVLTQGKFELELAWRTLAEAVLDSEQNPVPFGTAEQWGRLVPEVVGDLWIQYAELRAEHDPQVAELTEGEVRGIPRRRSKKKRSSVAVLRCVEAVTLSAFFGRPACQLLDREVLAWGLVTGHLTLGGREPPPNGRRFKNVDALPPESPPDDE